MNRGSCKATKNKKYVKISTIVSFKLNNKQNISYLKLRKLLQLSKYNKVKLLTTNYNNY